MTIKEIYASRSERMEEVSELRNLVNQLFINEVTNRLKELKLDGRVVRKKNGHIGELVVVSTTVMFYPITKKGEVSKKREYFWHGDLEEEFEPYVEAE